MRPTSPSVRFDGSSRPAIKLAKKCARRAHQNFCCSRALAVRTSRDARGFGKRGLHSGGEKISIVSSEVGQSRVLIGGNACITGPICARAVVLNLFQELLEEPIRNGTRNYKKRGDVPYQKAGFLVVIPLLRIAHGNGLLVSPKRDADASTGVTTAAFAMAWAADSIESGLVQADVDGVEHGMAGDIDASQGDAKAAGGLVEGALHVLDEVVAVLAGDDAVRVERAQEVVPARELEDLAEVGAQGEARARAVHEPLRAPEGLVVGARREVGPEAAERGGDVEDGGEAEGGAAAGGLRGVGGGGGGGGGREAADGECRRGGAAVVRVRIGDGADGEGPLEGEDVEREGGGRGGCGRADGGAWRGGCEEGREEGGQEQQEQQHGEGGGDDEMGDGGWR